MVSSSSAELSPVEKKGTLTALATVDMLLAVLFFALIAVFLYWWFKHGASPR